MPHRQLASGQSLMVGKIGSMKTVDGYGIPYLSSVTLHDVHPFGPQVTFRFDPRVNVLIEVDPVSWTGSR